MGQMTDARTQCVWLLLLQLNPELEFDLSILRGDIGHDTYCPFPYSLSLSLWPRQQLSASGCWRCVSAAFSQTICKLSINPDWADWDRCLGLEPRDAALIDQNPCGSRMLWQPRSIPSFMRSALSAVRHQQQQQPKQQPDVCA